jgi:hypothetical protein
VLRGTTWEAWIVLTERPIKAENPARQHRLRGQLATRETSARALDQWHYEVTAGGRIWFCPGRAAQHRPGRRRRPEPPEENLAVRTSEEFYDENRGWSVGELCSYPSSHSWPCGVTRTRCRSPSGPSAGPI